MEQARTVPRQAAVWSRPRLGARRAVWTVLWGLVATLMAQSAAAEPPCDRETTRLADHPSVDSALTLLDLWIDEKVAYESPPSLAIGIVFDQELVWSKAYGLADLEAGTPATNSTRYRAGSVTKVFTATAVMQLRDAGSWRSTTRSRATCRASRCAIPSSTPTRSPSGTCSPTTSGLPREGAFPYWTSHEFPARDELLRRSPISLTARRRAKPTATRTWGSRSSALSSRSSPALHSTSTCGRTSWRRWAWTTRPSASTPATRPWPRAICAARGTAPGGCTTPTRPPPWRRLPAWSPLCRTWRASASLQFRDGEAGDDQILRGATLREMHRVHFVYPSWTGGMGLGFRVGSRDGKTTVSHGGWIGGHRAHLLMVPDEKIAVVALTNADDASPIPSASKPTTRSLRRCSGPRQAGRQRKSSPCRRPGRSTSASTPTPGAASIESWCWRASCR